ncbi:tyrosine-type recombinase/integrase [Falsiroseomonas bella]|nr:tyrosine-type recombinase/integrase [Falsiroseomonas bella]
MDVRDLIGAAGTPRGDAARDVEATRGAAMQTGRGLSNPEGGRRRRRGSLAKGLHLKRRGRIWQVVGTYRGTRVRRTTGETDRDRAHRHLADALREIDARFDGVVLPPPRAPAAPPPPPPVAVLLVEPEVRDAPPKATFGEAVQVYLADEARSPDTETRVKRLLGLIGPDTRCEDITANFLKEVVRPKVLSAKAERAERRGKAPPDTIPAVSFGREVVIPAKAVLNLAARRLGATRGCFRPEFDPIPVSKRREVCLRPDDAERIIEVAKARGEHTLVVVLVVGVCEGPRRGDFHRLHWSDVDLERGSMLLGRVKSLPGQTRERLIPEMRPRTVQALREYRALTGISHGPVFRTADGTPFPDPGALGKKMNRVLREIAVELKIPDARRLTMHPLRHTSASWDYADDRDILRVKERGDWKSLESVERYIHLLPNKLAPLVRAFFAGRAEARS